MRLYFALFFFLRFQLWLLTRCFRLLQSLVSLPLFASISMISEVDFAHDIECEESGLCNAQDVSEMKLFAFRDLVSIQVNVSSGRVGFG